MGNGRHRIARAVVWMIVASLTMTPYLVAADLDRLRGLVASGHADQAIAELLAEVDENPAHEAARILLARALEGADRRDEAVDTWQTLLMLSSDEATRREARRSISRLTRSILDESDRLEVPLQGVGDDPFRLPMPTVRWAGLKVIEDVNYRSSVLPAPYDFGVPPFAHETSHFTVYSTNERLSRTIGERAEIFLDFMVTRLLGGRSWAVRIPILVYVDYDDYLYHGGPPGSAGMTLGHVSGRTQAIFLYQQRTDGELWRYGIESVLPHELTHAVINEFFAGRRPPQWLHEAIAGRFEQTRDHYSEAARLGRHVVGGEYFRMRDLFEQTSYPERIELFYEQSAAVVLYLFETGPDTMHAFLSELKAGSGHDAACAAALGIPEHRAVERFEKMWVRWIERLYRQRLGGGDDDRGLARSRRRDPADGQRPPDELAVVADVRDWRTIDLASWMKDPGAANVLEGWRVSDGALWSARPPRGAVTMLPIRVPESPPLVVRADVVWRGRPNDDSNWFGFTQLDLGGKETPVSVLAPFTDLVRHELICVWADDLAVYLDGRCTGRYPAARVSGDAPDIDFPLAMIAHGPFEIRSVKVASLIPGPAAATEKAAPRGGRRRGAVRRGDRP